MDSIEVIGVIKEKLLYCCKLYNFRNEKDSIEEKKFKKDILIDLLYFIENTADSVILNDEFLQHCLKMITVNIFRTFNFISTKSKPQNPLTEPDDEDSLFERYIYIYIYSAWPHLQLVYEFFLKLISLRQFTSKVAEKYLPFPLIQKVNNTLD